MAFFGERSGRTRGSTESGDDANLPTSCPTCSSTSIATTAKTPDSLSYWRCNSCGEVWNGSRRQASRDSGRRWR
jgi:transposase-like protein